MQENKSAYIFCHSEWSPDPEASGRDEIEESLLFPPEQIRIVGKDEISPLRFAAFGVKTSVEMTSDCTR